MENIIITFKNNDDINSYMRDYIDLLKNERIEFKVDLAGNKIVFEKLGKTIIFISEETKDKLEKSLKELKTYGDGGTNIRLLSCDDSMVKRIVEIEKRLI